MLTFWQKLQSLFYPVSIRNSPGTGQPAPELFYYHGRYMLATANAVYSDGAYYRPLVAAFTSPVLKPCLAAVQRVLVLGTGLASAVHVLHRYGYHPHFTLVEIDAQALDWAMEFLPAESAGQVVPVCANAAEFIEADKETYDLIIIDIFLGLEVPEFVTQSHFVARCKARLLPQGCVVLNYMVNRQEDTLKAKTLLEAAFQEVTEISFGINKVYIAR
jgi:spermidine synthase